MSRLAIFLLGGFEVLLDGKPVTSFGTDKVRALLAYLALRAGRPHRRAALAGLLWPDLPQERAAHNLRQSLLRLRRALGDDEGAAEGREPFLLLAGQEVQFNPLSNHHIDVAEFLELLRARRHHQHPAGGMCSACLAWLEQAADMYRGDLLAGFSLRDSLPFDEWQVMEQETLRAQALEALGSIADHYERTGNAAQVLAYARRIVALEPWHERAQIQLMTALAQTGQEAAALEQYAHYRSILAQEFSLAPSAEVSALYEQIQARRLRAAGQTSQAVSAAPLDERRQMTALVCRRQAASGSSDPEEVRDLIARCAERCAPVLERFGGRKQPGRGAECLIYFGYPAAQEDSARRAIDAALELAALAPASEVLRAGVHTGLMVASGEELIGSVPDLAADCMRLAGAGEVVVSAETERLTLDWFRFAPRGETTPGGRAVAYRAEGRAGPPHSLGRFARVPDLTPLAGRARDLALLDAGLAAVAAGHGRLITVRGEAGIGKSRLLWELKQRFAGQVRWLESSCSPYFGNTSLYPIIGLLERLLGFTADTEALARRAKLEAALAAAPTTRPASSWLLSLLLGIPTEQPAPAILTDQQRELMREEAAALVQREAARSPIALVIEDLHWSDPTTISWITRSLDALLGSPCALILTWRPDFHAPWPPRRGALELDLAPLDAASAGGMVAAIEGANALSADARNHIVRQADGIPLYLEELTHALSHAATRAPAGAGAQPELPATLRDSLTAHLDRTGVARETAQWAAALGRGFSYAVLAAVSPFDEARLQSDLDLLVERRVLSPVENAGRPGYAFRHALLQDAAYSMLVKPVRQAYHRRIAETLAASFPGIAEGRPEVLAHHYSEAGLRLEAADAWTLAAERALAQGATLEAREHYDRALAALAPEDRDRRWRALAGRVRVFDLRAERASQRADIDSMLAIADELGDDARRWDAYLLQSRFASRVDDFQLLVRAAGAMLELALRLGDPALVLRARSRLIVGLVRVDRWDEAREQVDVTLALLPTVSDPLARAQAASGINSYYADLGDYEQAARLSLEAAEQNALAGETALACMNKRNYGFPDNQPVRPELYLLVHGKCRQGPGNRGAPARGVARVWRRSSLAGELSRGPWPDPG
ncbi:MAG: AAA family ATPase [Anaerolineae bacterium]|nr:AAA family ATPase [Anaerolineae bacterium]